MPTKASLEQEVWTLRGHLRQRDDTISELRAASNKKDAKIESKSLRVEELEVELERTKKSLRRALAEGAKLKDTAHARQGEVDSARSVKGLCEDSAYLAGRIDRELTRNKGDDEPSAKLLADVVTLRNRLGEAEKLIGPFAKFPDTDDENVEEKQTSSGCEAGGGGSSLKRQRESGPGTQLQLTDGLNADLE